MADFWTRVADRLPWLENLGAMERFTPFVGWTPLIWFPPDPETPNDERGDGARDTRRDDDRVGPA